MSPDWDAEAVAKACLPYLEYRAWRAWAIGRPYPKTWKRRRVKPFPGVYDLVATEEG